MCAGAVPAVRLRAAALPRRGGRGAKGARCAGPVPAVRLRAAALPRRGGRGEKGAQVRCRRYGTAQPHYRCACVWAELRTRRRVRKGSAPARAHAQGHRSPRDTPHRRS
ncbi:hypothetical protein chiPu_0030856 [Chiloscyllium punctatum]|uniref:Uncharacterized protein n=1 Tax=Chiloscyllium punctatum TaxID=137246 RepID=A0A401TVC8_CHIPU|nr:hypothetical protein [Chiloscyllium punctatum]